METFIVEDITLKRNRGIVLSADIGGQSRVVDEAKRDNVSPNALTGVHLHTVLLRAVPHKQEEEEPNKFELTLS